MTRATGVLDYEVGSARLCCAKAKPVREEFCRRLASYVLELPDEVCLIGQTTGMGNLCPRPAIPSFREDFLKPRQARKSLRTDAISGIEGTRKMACARVQFCREGMHLHCWLFAEMQRGAARQAIGVRPKMSKQEGLDTINPLFARPRAREHVVAHCHFTCAEQTSKVDIGVGELPERSLDYTTRRVRPEADKDNAECSSGAQSHGMRLNLGRAFRRQELRALTRFRRLSILPHQPERGARRAFDRKRPCEIVVRNVAIPDSLDDIGK
jgi:hypothetical protein